jgi:hypothetical protein
MKRKKPSRSESKPSVATKDYWLYAERKKRQVPVPGSKSGKWLVFVRMEEVDGVWAKIRKAVEDGNLGDEAKVATAKPTPYSQDDSRRVICVYTYDYEDIDDVRRIRAELRRLGVTDRIPYKSDEDTEAGKYSVKGRGRISKFFE